MSINSEVSRPNKMEEFWILIFVLFFATNTLDKAESVQLFDEIFGEGWWDKDKADEWDKLTLEHNFHCQIDQQNANHGQIEPNSTDQNPPLTESDKRKIVAKFQAIKDEFKQKGKFHYKERNQIEIKIAKHLKVSRSKIYKWKKEFGISQINSKNERKSLVEKFDQMKAELKRVGLKNTYPNQIDETVAKELGLSFRTIYNWKRKLGHTASGGGQGCGYTQILKCNFIKNKSPHNKQKELMKRYYEIKDKNLKIKNVDIAKMLKIGRATLYKWKKQFKQQQLDQNSVDGHSVEVNAAANVQEIGNIF